MVGKRQERAKLSHYFPFFSMNLKYMRFVAGLLIYLCTYAEASAQLVVYGKVTSEEDKEPVAYVMVSLYVHSSNKLLGFSQTNEEGVYSLSIESVYPAITLKARGLSYHTYTRDIVLSASHPPDSLEISFSMLPKSMVLDELVIEAKPPILVKEDTIIYDIAHFTRESDQTLEEVLMKIPGIKVMPDGSIQVNGEAVGKVLIDGKLVSDAGAAIITKSLDPKIVESVEVRFDEKDAKFKDSLIDTDRLVVLDIKLKSDVKKSLIGKARFTAGHKQSLMPGGYLNALSLQPGNNNHVFIEHDRFGHQTIRLDQIKNIGEEALQKIYSLPADFDELSQRKAFNKEMYGFKDYTRSDLSVMGITSQVQVSPALNFFFGTYNSFSIEGKERQTTQVFSGEQEAPFLLMEGDRIRDFDSKTKLDLRFDKGKSKIRLDANLVVADNSFLSLADEPARDLTYRFEKGSLSLKTYTNFFLENLLWKKGGIQLKASHSYSKNQIDGLLRHNDDFYKRFFPAVGDVPFWGFGQRSDIRLGNFFVEASSWHQFSFGTLRPGINWQSVVFRAEKSGFLEDGMEVERQAQPDNIFTGSSPGLHYQKAIPFLEHTFSKGKWQIRNSLGLGLLSIPNEGNQKQFAQMAEYASSLTYRLPQGRIAIAYSRKLSPFPISALAEGADLLGYRSIGITQGQRFTQKPEHVFELNFNKLSGNQTWEMVFGGAAGKTEKGSIVGFSSFPFIETVYAQLAASYIIAEAQLKYNFPELPFRMELINSFIARNIENQLPAEEIFQTITTRYLTELKFSAALEAIPASLYFTTKHSLFVFDNELLTNNATQRFISITVGQQTNLFKNKLMVSPSARAVSFFGDTPANNLNIAMDIRWLGKKFQCFLEMDNLLNNTDFIRRNITPAFLVTDTQAIFGRYAKAGFEYRF